MGFSFPLPTLSSCEQLSAALPHSIPPCSRSSAPPLYTDIGGTMGSNWPTAQEGGNGATHLLGPCSPPQELPCPHQDEGGFPEEEACSSSGDVSQGKELLSPLELGSGEELSFPRQRKTGCSPGQRSERWQKDLGHPAKCSHPSQLHMVLNHHPWISLVVSRSFTPGVQALPLQHVIFLRHQHVSGFRKTNEQDHG